jgi:hypothetical protein
LPIISQTYLECLNILIQVYNISQWLEKGVFPNIEKQYLSALHFVLLTSPPHLSSDGKKRSCHRNRHVELFEFRFLDQPDNDTSARSIQTLPDQLKTSLTSLLEYCNSTSSTPTAEKGDSVLFTFVLEYKNETPKSLKPEYFSKSDELDAMQEFLDTSCNAVDNESTEIVKTENNIPFLSSSSDSVSDDSLVKNSIPFDSKLNRNTKQNNDLSTINNCRMVSVVSLPNSKIETFVQRIELPTSTFSLGEIEQLLFKNKSINEKNDVSEESSFERIIKMELNEDELTSEMRSSSRPPKRKRQRNSSEEQGHGAKMKWSTTRTSQLSPYLTTPTCFRTSNANPKFRTPVSEAATLFVPLSTPSKHKTTPALYVQLDSDDGEGYSIHNHG